MEDRIIMKIANRFDGLLPVVLDVETGGLNSETDALLEIAAIILTCTDEGLIVPGKTFSTHVEALIGLRLDPAALAVNKIDPYHPFRFAIPEKEALELLFQEINIAIKETGCRRAVLVGHNANFDLGFLLAACKRSKIKMPFHSFTCFDTATLGGLAYGKTVLAKILAAADIEFDEKQAHSAVYDCDRTAELFCKIVNNFRTKA